MRIHNNSLHWRPCRNGNTLTAARQERQPDFGSDINNAKIALLWEVPWSLTVSGMKLRGSGGGFTG
jgi:hypothetical protein